MNTKLKLRKMVFSKDDDTIKYVFLRNSTSATLEFSYINKKDGKNIICVPCQTMCNIGCKFCHTKEYIGIINVTPISADELVEGIEYIYNDLKLDKNPKTLLVSFMGCGEPILNVKNVIQSMSRIRDNYPKLYVRFAIATSLPNYASMEFFRLSKLIKSYELDVKLHLSLHYTNNELRKEWMPKSMNIESTLASGEFYRVYTSNKVEIHYALIDGINDSVEDAVILCNLLKGKDFNVKFLFYNEKTSLGMHPSEIAKFEMFQEYLNQIGISSEYYKPPGLDVGASCGQFLMDEYLQPEI